jgi:hypothetical protein
MENVAAAAAAFAPPSGAPLLHAPACAARAFVIGLLKIQFVLVTYMQL